MIRLYLRSFCSLQYKKYLVQVLNLTRKFFRPGYCMHRTNTLHSCLCFFLAIIASKVLTESLSIRCLIAHCLLVQVYHECVIMEAWLCLTTVTPMQNVYPQNFTDWNCEQFSAHNKIYEEHDCNGHELQDYQ